MEQLFTYTVHIPGTLTADLEMVFSLPCSCQLIHVSAAGSNRHDALFQITGSEQADACLHQAAVGCLGQPAVAERRHFSGGQYPHFAQGELVTVKLDYDGEEGNAVQNLTLALTFAHG